MSDPYRIDEPAVVYLSGGRTSGYMLYRILEAHEGLPDHIKVMFANTGKEMPQTLDFVRDIGERWGVDISWVEAKVRAGGEGENKYVYETVVVDHATASRDGRPFEELIIAHQYLPNPVAKFCTAELKVRRIKDHINSLGWTEWLQLIGIRADEPRRAVKIHNQNVEGNEAYLPLYEDGITKEDVGRFWQRQNFDLQLSNNNGVTDWGNCDLCYLKGYRKRLSIIIERPDLADWWIRQEARYIDSAGRGGMFRVDQPGYAKMLEFATNQGDLFDFDDDDTIPCMCTD